MNNATQIIVGKTKEGKYQLAAVKYGQKTLKNGVLSFEPTKQARAFLRRYVCWQNLSIKMHDNWIFQNDLKEAFDKYL